MNFQIPPFLLGRSGARRTREVAHFYINVEVAKKRCSLQPWLRIIVSVRAVVISLIIIVLITAVIIRLTFIIIIIIIIIVVIRFVIIILEINIPL